MTPSPPGPLSHTGERGRQNRTQKTMTSLARRASFFLPLSPLWERGPGGEGADSPPSIPIPPGRASAIRYKNLDDSPVGRTAMLNVGAVIDHLERLCPPRLAAD